ncbi:MAG: DNA-binding transcriptional regulator [Thermoguttaceae bacterium]|nr:DNA-binding transcriptional regulator [Thermoguttaceae bacterium]MBR4752044.1 DNA-binding transcriptional regulator [Thermoguttaceae bacterium]
MAIKSQPLKVALLIETSRSYGRGVLQGVARYSRLHGPWRFLLTPGDFEQVLPKMRDWKGDGVIARTLNEKSAEAILEMGLPTVLLDYSVDKLDLPKEKTRFCVDLTSDSVGAARLAAKCLLDKKISRFAYVGYPFQSWSIKRERAFVDAIAEVGLETQVYRAPLHAGRPLRWEKEEAVLSAWLKALPKPIGIMACNDQRGREILDACELAGISAPEQVAVVGVDADEVLCELSVPSLTSVALNAEKGGYVAASVLAEMMNGLEPSVKHILVEPLGVVERRSSNIVLVDDEDVAQALQMIHTDRLETVSVDRIARDVAVSRRTLEIKFRKYLGRTILDEIKNVRIERAKQMLRESDASIERIALTVGFSATSYFIQTFRKEAGVTPARYRRDVRGE